MTDIQIYEVNHITPTSPLFHFPRQLELDSGLTFPVVHRMLNPLLFLNTPFHGSCQDLKIYFRCNLLISQKLLIILKSTSMNGALIL